MCRFLRLTVAVDTLEVFEYLGQVLGSSIADSPLELAWVPLGFSSFFLGGCLLRGGFFAFLAFSFYLLLDNYLRLEYLPLVLHKVGFLLVELKRDNGGDITNLLLNLEQFIHCAHLKYLICLIKLILVEQALKKHKSLSCALFSDSLLDQAHNEVIIVVDWRVLCFFKLVFDSIIQIYFSLNKILLVFRSGELLADRGLIPDVLVDQLVN